MSRTTRLKQIQDIDDCTPAEQQCVREWLLHSEAGYHYDGNGVIAALTVQEEHRLMTGRAIWSRLREAEREQQSDDRPGQAATAGDHEAFDEYARQANT